MESLPPILGCPSAGQSAASGSAQLPELNGGINSPLPKIREALFAVFGRGWSLSGGDNGLAMGDTHNNIARF